MIYYITISSSSSLKSPNKPAVPPKPRNISNKSSPSPKKSSPELNGVSHNTNFKCNTNGDTPVKMQVRENIYPIEKTENGINKGIFKSMYNENCIIGLMYSSFDQ